MQSKKSLAQKENNERLDRIIARCAWLAIFLALAGILAYVQTSHDTFNGIIFAVFFPIIFGVIAYIFSPGDKHIIIHLLQEWRLAASLGAVLVIGTAAMLFYQYSQVPPPPKKVIKIGVDLPLTGDDKTDGEGVLNGINVALKEAGKVGEYEFAVEKLSDDNTATRINDPDVGAANIKTLIKDQRVVGIIGPYNSAVALKEIPIINGDNEGGQKIALISPSVTADCLTTGLYPMTECNNLNNKGSFFRIAALNTKVGEVFANCLSAPSMGPRDLCPNPHFHIYKSVVIIEDSTPYSVGFAQSFRQYWSAKDGTKSVIKEVSNKAGRQSFEDTLQNATRELGQPAPDLVFFAGSEENAKLLHQVMQQSGPSMLPDLTHVPFASGASIMNPDFVKHLRDQPPYAPVYVAAPIRTLSQTDTNEQKDSTAFAQRYQKEYGVKHTPYSAAGYDATKIIIQAVKEAAGKGGVPDLSNDIARQDFRNKVTASIKSPIDNAVTGLTGRYAFNENGDFNDSATSVFQWNTSNPYGWDYQ